MKKQLIQFLASSFLLGISISTQAQEDWVSKEYNGAPWTSNVSHPHTITQGLANKHVSISASHGKYWNNDKQEWAWQRPHLYCTTEDLFTQTIVIPYLIPMMEKAGAIVFSPRERSWQKNEVIVDNDTKSSGYKEQNNRQKWQKSNYPGFSNAQRFYRDEENPFQMGTARVCATTADKNLESLAIWSPTIPESGKYSVYISYQSFMESADDALYTIHHAGGKTEFHVNQKIGGGIWVYLGTFEFNTQRPDQAMVTLSNYSKHNGVVVADAIRFGGGMGNIIRDENATTSGLPRFLEGARYSTQWYGFPYDVYSSYKGEKDYNDDINSRSFATNYLTGGSIFNPDSLGIGVPIELQLAIHSDAGVTTDKSWVGSMTICSTENDSLTNYPGGISRQASKNYATMLLNNLTRDLDSEYKLNWIGREIRDRNYSESKRAHVPSAIFELLSHQNFEDIQFGHDPNAKFSIARSIYKTTARFINNTHHKETTIAPLPIHAFAIEFGNNANEIILSWKPTLDPQDITAVPTSYIIYTRTGDNGFDNGQVVNATSAKMSIVPGNIYSFKITAINPGGESMDSEILCAYISPSDSKQKRVLIINGFERLSGPKPIETENELGFDIMTDIGVPYMSTPGFSGAQISFNKAKLGSEREDGCGYSGSELEGMLIVGNTFDNAYLHGKAIATTGQYSFVSCSKEAVEKSTVNLSDYAIVDLLLGLQKNDGWSLKYYKTFTPELIAHIKSYLHRNGSLFVSGSYIGSDMQSPEEQNFTSTYLKYALDETLVPTMQETSAINGCGMKIRIPRTFNEKQYAVQTADCLRPMGAAFPAFAYAENNRCAGIAYQGKDYKLMATGFPFESINNETDRAKIMTAILQFLAK